MICKPEKVFSKSELARCPAGGKHALWSLVCAEMKVSFTVVSQLPGVFPPVGHCLTCQVAKSLPQPFSLSPIPVSFLEHKEVAQGEMRNRMCGCKDVLPQPQSNASLMGPPVTSNQWQGCKAEGPSWFHSALIHIRTRSQSKNNHNQQPHLASEHLVYFAA